MVKCKYQFIGASMGRIKCHRQAEFDRSLCPKNTDNNCNIIPRKKSKPKYRKVRAWAFVQDGTYTWTHRPVLCGAKTVKDDMYKIPCTITIAERYLKGRTK